MLIVPIVFLILGFVAGYFVYHATKVLDLSMDYPSPLWKVRYWLATKHCLTEEIKEILDVYLKAAKDSHLYESGDQPTANDIIDTGYKVVADQNPKFKRWICVKCMSIYFALIVTIVVTAFLIPLYGIESALFAVGVIPGLGQAIGD